MTEAGDAGIQSSYSGWNFQSEENLISGFLS